MLPPGRDANLLVDTDGATERVHGCDDAMLSGGPARYFRTTVAPEQMLDIGLRPGTGADSFVRFFDGCDLSACLAQGEPPPS